MATGLQLKRKYESVRACAGLFAKSYKGYPEWLYGTSYYNDKLMLAAGWLYRATGVCSKMKGGLLD